MVSYIKFIKKVYVYTTQVVTLAGLVVDQYLSMGTVCLSVSIVDYFSVYRTRMFVAQAGIQTDLLCIVIAE